MISFISYGSTFLIIYYIINSLSLFTEGRIDDLGFNERVTKFMKRIKPIMIIIDLIQLLYSSGNYSTKNTERKTIDNLFSKKKQKETKLTIHSLYARKRFTTINLFNYFLVTNDLHHFRKKRLNLNAKKEIPSRTWYYPFTMMVVITRISRMLNIYQECLTC